MEEFTQHLEEIARTLRAYPETKIQKSVFRSFRFSRATEYEDAFKLYMDFRRNNPDLFELPGIIAEPAQSETTPEGFRWSFEAEISGYEIGLECTLENLQACMCILLRDEITGKGIECELCEGTAYTPGLPCFTYVRVLPGDFYRHLHIAWDMQTGGYSFFNGGGGVKMAVSLETMVRCIQETSATFAAQKR
jgi:hypothetical protein